MNDDRLDADFMQWARQEGLIDRITTAHELAELRKAYKAGYAAASADAEDMLGRPLTE